MRRGMALALLIFFSLLSAGCWNRVELDERAIIAGFGVDAAREGGQMEVTVQVIRPAEVKAGTSAPAGSPKAVVVYSGTGYTFFDCLRNLAKAVGRKLFNAKAKIVVVGEELAEEGMGAVTDLFDRNHELSTRSCLLIAKGRAKEVLKTEYGTEKIWAYGIEHLVKASAAHGKSPRTEVRDFLRAVESKTTAPVVCAVEVVPGEGAGGLVGKNGEKGEKETALPSKNIVVSGAAVFSRYRLAGWLNEEETRGFLWATGKMKGGIVVVPSPGSENKMIALEVIRASAKIKPEILGRAVRFAVEVKEEANLGEQQPDSLDITAPGAIEELEARSRAAIEREIGAALAKARALNADIFGLGEALRRQYPGEWEQMADQWDAVFPQVEVVAEVEARIRRTGKITVPAGL